MIQAFEREQYAAGEQLTAGWPFHDQYGPDHPPDEQREAELTAGFPVETGQDYGFFTDTSLCIGCKACEVACKEWNNLPADEMEFLATSYDNTHTLGANTWRHVRFIEQPPGEGVQAFRRSGVRPADWSDRTDRADESELATQNVRTPERLNARTPERPPPRWLMQSDVCKHCEHAGCLEACPTGAIIRTEFGTVVIQQDICNGCQYCIPSCPYGVISLDEGGDGKAHKCTLCYDRLKGGMEPACAKACPTDSIQFGPVDALRERAATRVAALREHGLREAQLYGAPAGEGATHGIESLRSFFLLLDHPNVYNLPAAPRLPSRNIKPGLLASLAAAALLIGATAASFLGGASK